MAMIASTPAAIASTNPIVKFMSSSVPTPLIRGGARFVPFSERIRGQDLDMMPCPSDVRSGSVTNCWGNAKPFAYSMDWRNYCICK
jgi:hypothetical protein